MGRTQRVTRIVFLVLLSALAITCEYVETSTSNGKIMGDCEQGFCVFKGIPYAESTAGANRWMPPIPKASWAPNVFNALDFVPECPQDVTVPTSEDCLALNVWTPSTVFYQGVTDLPVFFWIHGGAFVAGTGSEPTFAGNFLSNTSGIVLVTINYRLGPLGFLNTPNLPGNYGLLDQQLALQWVQNNIESFGGSKNKVTLGGQSAGAMSVTLHMLINNSTNLFQSAIIESNPAAVLYRTPSQNVAYAEKFASHVNCSYLDNDCLRAVPVSEIQKITNVPSYIITIPLSTLEFLPWAPNVDGTLIPYQPMSMIYDGLLKSCPVLIGNVQNETNRFVPDVPIGNIAYNDMLKAIFSDYASSVEAIYPSDRRDSVQQLQMLTTDYYFVCPSRKIAEISSTMGNPTYLYMFDHAPTDDYIATSPLCSQGPCHSAELPFVFHSQYLNNATWTLDEVQLSFNIMEYWKTFIFGDSLEADVPSDVISWPEYKTATNTSILLNLPLNTTINYRSYYCNFWDSLGYIF